MAGSIGTETNNVEEPARTGAAIRVMAARMAQPCRRSPTITPNIQHSVAKLFAQMLPAFANGSVRDRRVIRSMARIVSDPKADAGERTAAIDTLVDVLFPPRGRAGRKKSSRR